MRAAKWFLVLGLLTLVCAGVFINSAASVVLFAFGAGALAGAINVFIGGLHGRE